LLSSVEEEAVERLIERCVGLDVHKASVTAARWDPEALRDDVRAYVVEHLGDPGGVLVVDETSSPLTHDAANRLLSAGGPASSR
jgi:SRSO17 transposase